MPKIHVLYKIYKVIPQNKNVVFEFFQEQRAFSCDAIILNVSMLISSVPCYSVFKSYKIFNLLSVLILDVLDDIRIK